MQEMIPWQRAGQPGAITALPIDLAHAGLLAIDLQYACATPDEGFPGNERAWQPAVVARWGEIVRGRVLPNVERLLAWFRARELAVVHTRVGSYLPSGRDLHPRRRESNLRHRGEPPFRCAFGDPLHAILAEVAPAPRELVIDKNTSGAFVGSPIDFYLRNLGLQTLVACGIATQACVHHTVRDAADLGYNVILVSDGCWSSPGDDHAHERTLRVFGRLFGAVKTTDEVLADLERLAQPTPLSARAP
jgi:nicotinamidase-related amidase